MDFGTLLSQLSAFRSSHELIALANLPESPQETARAHLERELVKKGRVLLNRLQEVKEQQSRLEDEQEEIMASLQKLQEEARCTVDLPLGKTLTLDVSSGPLFAELWQDIERLTGKKALYNVSLLAEESDELLTFL